MNGKKNLFGYTKKQLEDCSVDYLSDLYRMLKSTNEAEAKEAKEALDFLAVFHAAEGSGRFDWLQSHLNIKLTKEYKQGCCRRAKAARRDVMNTYEMVYMSDEGFQESSISHNLGSLVDAMKEAKTKLREKNIPVEILFKKDKKAQAPAAPVKVFSPEQVKQLNEQRFGQKQVSK